MTEKRKLFYLFGSVCVAAGMMGGIGDICLLYSPEGGYLDGDFQFLREIGQTRALWGHYLGIIFIPLQICGMWIIYQGLRPAGKGLALGSAILGGYATVVGVAYHGGIYPLIKALQTDPGMNESLLEWMKAFSEPLGLGFAVGFLLLMGSFSVLVLIGKSHFPKWTVLLSPIVTYPLIVLLYLGVPPIGNFLAPAGFNLSLILFYGAILYGTRLPEEGETV